jgi:hypothetical protein
MRRQRPNSEAEQQNSRQSRSAPGRLAALHPVLKATRNKPLICSGMLCEQNSYYLVCCSAYRNPFRVGIGHKRLAPEKPGGAKRGKKGKEPRLRGGGPD